MVMIGRSSITEDERRRARKFVQNLPAEDLENIYRKNGIWKYVGRGTTHRARESVLVEEAKAEITRRRRREDGSVQQQEGQSMRLSNKHLLGLLVGAAAVTIFAGGGNHTSR